MFEGKGVLLACEVVGGRGDGWMVPDIEIVVDEGRVMVRYVFLIERSGWVQAEEVTPVIESVLRDLREGRL